MYFILGTEIVVNKLKKGLRYMRINFQSYKRVALHYKKDKTKYISYHFN